MRARSLGVGGATVTVVGSGEIGLALAAARGIDPGEVGRAVHAAIDRGITLIDIAADDDTERMVGDAVRTLRARDSVVVATRMGVASNGELPIAHVVQRIDASLRATRLDALPLALLPHRRAWTRTSAWADLRGACARMVHDGKVINWGAIVDPLDAPAPDDDPGASVVGMTEHDHVAAIVVTYNVCDRAAEAVIAAAAARGIAVLARRPLAGGALAGALGPGVKLAFDDDRRTLDDAQLVMIAEVIGSLAGLVSHVPPAARSCATARGRLERACTRRPAEIECATVAELALRFAIDRAGVTAVLPRLHRVDHLDEAIAAAGAKPLSAALIERVIAEIVELTAS